MASRSHKEVQTGTRKKKLMMTGPVPRNFPELILILEARAGKGSQISTLELWVRFRHIFPVRLGLQMPWLV
jgi:hypothetical protein